jgi:hypothetical protein
LRVASCTTPKPYVLVQFCACNTPRAICHPSGFRRKGIDDIVIEHCVTALKCFNFEINRQVSACAQIRELHGHGKCIRSNVLHFSTCSGGGTCLPADGNAEWYVSRSCERELKYSYFMRSILQSICCVLFP